MDLRQIQKMKDAGAHLITISSNGKWLVYHFRHDAEIKNLKFPATSVKSITKIYPGAELYEREIMEKYGVKFRGHPNPVKLFT
ncbi:MAG: NADH-quinone oxidoreductase subunit C [Candidatus Altiarchaeota archaeon]|nr:NADH-quinone oxidoreductase subunit C [Candidatus Altiarchaeota archaeon]